MQRAGDLLRGGLAIEKTTVDGVRPLAALPSGPVIEIAVDELRTDLSPRAGLYDHQHAAVLAEVLPRLPPIVVHRSTLQIIDGVHRVMAARLRGEATTRAVAFEGSQSDAYVWAVRCNVSHGKPLTAAERETAARQILCTHPTWSDRSVAALCGLSPSTIARIRRATDQSEQLRARMGRDGRQRPTDPVEMRYRIAEALKASPSASTRQVASLTGASQATVRDVRTRLDTGQDVLPPRLARALPHGSRHESAPDRSSAGNGSNVHLDGVPCGAPLSQVAREFADWFESRVLRTADEWEPLIDQLPVSRVYEVADEARRCASQWSALAEALERRARLHRTRSRT